jgi:hypothetical protein
MTTTKIEDRMWRLNWLRAEVTFTCLFVDAAVHNTLHDNPQDCPRSALVAAFAARCAAVSRLMYLYAGSCS